jgi:hypothetical protein
MKTRYGSYKFLVMSFRLCNDMLTFTTLMNFIFHEKSDVFVTINIDDILVYSIIVEEHAKHLEYGLSKL